MQIKDYKKGDEKEIIKLFEKCFNSKISIEQWQWRFQDNPAGKHLIKLMWDDEKLVGHYAVAPVEMRLGDAIIPTALSLTTMTHPDYGGQGVFKKLSVSLYDKLENEMGIKAIWGFPNNNSHYGFIKYLDWDNIALLHTLSVKSTRLDRPGTISLREVDSFRDAHVRLLGRETSKFTINVKRDLAYLKWRYIDKPSTKYRIFEWVHNDNLEALIVTKTYQASKELYNINVVELAIKDVSKLREILSALLSHYKERIDRVTIWKNLFDEQHIYFEKYGFAPDAPLTFLGMRCKNDLRDKLLDIKNWYYSFGDSDVY